MTVLCSTQAWSTDHLRGDAPNCRNCDPGVPGMTSEGLRTGSMVVGSRNLGSRNPVPVGFWEPRFPLGVALSTHGGEEIKGCPSLACIGTDPHADQSWCDTKDPLCKEQIGDEIGHGNLHFGLDSAHLAVFSDLCLAGRSASMYAERCALREHRLYYVLIGALCPMLCPNNVFRRVA